MKVDYRKKFLKELSKIPSGTKLKIEQFVFEELPKASSIFELGIVAQMKGYPSYYKVRFGSYRIGEEPWVRSSFFTLYSIKAGTRRIDGSEKSNVSDVTITEKGAPNFSDKDRIKRVSLDLDRPVLHSTGNTTSCT